jgi:hypothetical protein
MGKNGRYSTRQNGRRELAQAQPVARILVGGVSWDGRTSDRMREARRGDRAEAEAAC